MSKVLVFCLFDRKLREYGPPLVAANTDVMYRELRRNVQQGSMLQKYPEDFDLYVIGSQETETGVLERVDVQLVENLRAILPESE